MFSVSVNSMSVASKNYNFYVKNASIIFGFFLDRDDEQDSFARGLPQDNVSFDR